MIGIDLIIALFSFEFEVLGFGICNLSFNEL